MVNIIRDTNYEKVAEGAKPDTRNRVILPKVLVREGITYHIYVNSDGQILLDPQVTIPASEAWLYKNPDAIASVRRALSDAEQGRVSKVDLRNL